MNTLKLGKPLFFNFDASLTKLWEKTWWLRKLGFKPPEIKREFPADLQVPVKTIHLELVRKEDAKYPAVCEATKQVYWEELGVLLTSFPPTFITLFEDTKVIGGIGLIRGNEKNPLQIEKYYSPNNLLAEFSQGQCSDRSKMGEVGYLSLIPAYRHLSPVLITTMATYADKIGIPYLFITGIITVQRIIKQIGILPISTFFCEAKLEKGGYLEAEKKNWARYFELRPKCYGIPSDKATHVAQKCLSQITPAIPFMYGHVLKSIIL